MQRRTRAAPSEVLEAPVSRFLLLFLVRVLPRVQSTCVSSPVAPVRQSAVRPFLGVILRPELREHLERHKRLPADSSPATAGHRRHKDEDVAWHALVTHCSRQNSSDISTAARNHGGVLLNGTAVTGRSASRRTAAQSEQASMADGRFASPRSAGFRSGSASRTMRSSRGVSERTPLPPNYDAFGQVRRACCWRGGGGGGGGGGGAGAGGGGRAPAAAPGSSCWCRCR